MEKFLVEYMQGDGKSDRSVIGIDTDDVEEHADDFEKFIRWDDCVIYNFTVGSFDEDDFADKNIRWTKAARMAVEEHLRSQRKEV